MKCLYLVCDAPLSYNYSGAASRYIQAFSALNGLGIELYVCRILSSDAGEKIRQFEEKEAGQTASVRSKAMQWTDLQYTTPPRFTSKVGGLRQLLSNPLEYAYPMVTQLKGEIRKQIDRIKPDFIWAEWTIPAVLANIVAEKKIPYVYAHSDFLHRLYRRRKELSGNKISGAGYSVIWAMYRSEREIVRSAVAISAVSETEAVELRRWTDKPVLVIPQVYEQVAPPLPESEPLQPLRIVHLGSLVTTANAVGMTAWLERVQPVLDQMQANGEIEFETVIIGNNQNAKPALMEKLNRIQAVHLGHVIDLGTVLRPYDVAVIPYEANSGIRTKLALFFNHSQLVLSTRAAVAGSAELSDGENCVIVDSLEQFPMQLQRLYKDSSLRKKIADAGRATFERHYTLPSQIHLYEKIIGRIGQ